MGEKTNIAWTDSTFNPVIGCTKVGPGCDNCYAAEQDSRKRWGGKTHWGAGVPRYRTSASNWNQPVAWNRKASFDGKPHRVFCASLADVFDNEWPEGARDDLWALIKATPLLTWQIVTKRIGNAAKMLPADWGDWYPNVWLIATICNEKETRDIDKLIAIPAAVHGISYEPALESVDWSPWLCDGIPTNEQVYGERGAHYLRHGTPRLDWIIVGGESSQGGAQARPFNIEWARSTVAQCKAAGVACFVKQLGARPWFGTTRDGEPHIIMVDCNDRAGADPEEWPEDLRVREFPK